MVLLKRRYRLPTKGVGASAYVVVSAVTIDVGVGSTRKFPVSCMVDSETERLRNAVVKKERQEGMALAAASDFFTDIPRWAMAMSKIEPVRMRLTP